jgi:hypothetical protein
MRITPDDESAGKRSLRLRVFRRRLRFLAPASFASNRVTMRLTRRGGWGCTLASTANCAGLLQRLPADTLARCEQRAAALQYKLNAPDLSFTNNSAALAEAYRGCYQSTILPELQIAAQNPLFQAKALGDLAQWQLLVTQSGLESQLAGESQTAQVMSAQLAVGGQEALSNWRRLDVNHDGRVDEADRRLIFTNGLSSATIDVNGDGQLDILDYFEWLKFMTAGIAMATWPFLTTILCPSLHCRRRRRTLWRPVRSCNRYWATSLQNCRKGSNRSSCCK